MDLWNCDEPITDYDETFTVPPWIEQDITPATVAAILQGGCDSGAYMPAVTYYEADKTMSEHGDDVLEYIEDALGEIPSAHIATSWSGLAVFYLSTAVELWASDIEEILTEKIIEKEED